MEGEALNVTEKAGAVDGAGCRLYLVTPPSFDPGAFRDILAAALDAGDVAALQLRLKDVPDDAISRAIDILQPIAHAREVAFIVNDRPDLAVKHGCDGAHVGQEDTQAAIARKVLGADRMLGVTCHASRDLAMTAGEEGADYVAFGAFFPTRTKLATTHADLDLLRWWSDLMELPCVAIGGITADNCGPLVAAGADFLAVVSAVWDHPDGAAAGVRAMNAAIEAAMSEGDDGME
jgi:thiamine-phosphate pyrophosphorylase